MAAAAAAAAAAPPLEADVDETAADSEVDLDDASPQPSEGLGRARTPSSVENWKTQQSWIEDLISSERRESGSPAMQNETIPEEPNGGAAKGKALLPSLSWSPRSLLPGGASPRKAAKRTADDARRRSPELRRAVARANAAEAAQRKMSVEVQSLTTQLQTIAQRKRQGSR